LSYYVYILYSLTSDIYYVGQSEDVESRLLLHNSTTYKSFTTKHLPWELKLKLNTGNERGKAMKIERYIKQQKSRKYIELLLSSVELQIELVGKFSTDKNE